MNLRSWKTRLVREGKEGPLAGEKVSGSAALGAGNRLQRAARRLRLSVSGTRDDLGHAKHRRRWLAWELSD